MSRDKVLALSYAVSADLGGALLARVRAENESAMATQARAGEFLERTADFVDAHDEELKRDVASVLDGLLGK
ncbi:MAG: hypothetical protein HQL38_03230 [Alphaproteobacteria bacterium]|nr:hypothetical protein [Alphaproteobacteria bacterium]MBF0391674.1 hypothetical protein [Alphaproteobacteria bacterium]